MKFTKAGQQYLRELDSRVHRAKLTLKRDGFSHGREALILGEYIAELLRAGHNRTAVDIGAGDGMRWSNTYALFLEGWQGVGIELDSRKFVKLARAYKHFPDVYACRSRATPNNIVSLLQAYETPADLAVLSLDIDGYDYWVLRAVLSQYRPQLILTEINEKIPPPIRFVVKYDPNFQLRHHFYGYSMALLSDLCDEFGYVILTLEYNNAFLAPKELAAERGVAALAAYTEGYLDRPDRKMKFSLNFDMETVYSLSAEEAIDFLRHFYSKFAGEFYLGLSADFMTEGVNGEVQNV